MKAFIPVFCIAILSLAASNSVGRAQWPPMEYDYHLPGLDDNHRRSKIDRPRREPRVVTKGPLAPSVEDRTNYASFLQLSKTGLIRLFPRRLNQSKFTTAQPVKIKGGGAYYSFAFLSHEYGYGSDLELSTTVRFYNGIEIDPYYSLSVGFAGADYGMMTNLGDVSLETLTVDDPRAKFMVAYQPPRAESKARSEFRRFRDGISVDGQTYRSRLSIEVGTTYLLRSIVYRTSDVLVAFRVVRQDSDNSLIIAWRRLKEYARPNFS